MNTAEISQWFDEGVEQDKDHLVVIRDMFASEDIPVFTPGPYGDVYGTFAQYQTGDVSRVVGVYRLDRATKEFQLGEKTAWYFTTPRVPA